MKPGKAQTGPVWPRQVTLTLEKSYWDTTKRQEPKRIFTQRQWITVLCGFAWGRQLFLCLNQKRTLWNTYPVHEVLTVNTEQANCEPVVVDKFYLFSCATALQKQIMCHAPNCFKLWVYWPKKFKYYIVEGTVLAPDPVTENSHSYWSQDGSILLFLKIESTFLLSESIPNQSEVASHWFLTALCARVYISDISPFSALARTAGADGNAGRVPLTVMP